MVLPHGDESDLALAPKRIPYPEISTEGAVTVQRETRVAMGSWRDGNGPGRGALAKACRANLRILGKSRCRRLPIRNMGMTHYMAVRFK